MADDPPGSPADGECWLIDASPTGAWLDHEGELACYEAANWIFIVPRDGMQLLDRSTGQLRLYRDGWTTATAPSAPSGGATVDSEARATIVELIAALADAGILPG